MAKLEYTQNALLDIKRLVEFLIDDLKIVEIPKKAEEPKTAG